MSARRVAALLAAGILVIGFAVWLSSLRHLDRDLAAGDRVLPGLAAAVNTVTGVTLHKGDGTQATLRHEGGPWTVAERGWPADLNKVRKLLLDLGALSIVEEKTRLPANYPALGVEDVSSPQARGTLVTATAPARSWALIVGKPVGPRSGYVRVANAHQSLLASPAPGVDADPRNWLDHALLDVPAARMREIEEKPAQGPAWTAAREKKEQGDFTVGPLPKGRTLATAGAAQPVAQALEGLTLDDVRRAAADTGAPDRALFRTFDGLEIELAGRKDGAHAWVAIAVRGAAGDAGAEAQRLSDRLKGWEFELPDYKYAAIFMPIEQLLAKPPESAPKEGPSKAPARAPRAGAPAFSPAALPAISK